MPPQFPYKASQPETIRRSRTEPREGLTISWELVIVVLNTAEHLNVHCVSTYQAIFKKITTYILCDLTC